MSDIAIVLSNVGINVFHSHRVKEVSPVDNVKMLEFIGMADKNITRDGEILIYFEGIIKNNYLEEISLLRNFIVKNSETCLMVVVSPVRAGPINKQDVETCGNYWNNVFNLHLKQEISFDA